MDPNPSPAATPGAGRSHISGRWLAVILLLCAVLAGRQILYRRVWEPLVIRSFHRMYYDSQASTWANTRWQGVYVYKSPLDLWIFQEIIYDTKPDVIVEAGTFFGGSALFMAYMLDMLGHGQVVTIDIKEFPGLPQHPRIHYLLGSSTAPEIVEKVKSFITPQDRVMVVLDSDHHMPHVLNELRIYSKLVTKDNYFILEDTNINGHPVEPRFGPGPMEALEAFQRENSDFVSDLSREKYLVTFNPKGYLRKIR